MTPTRTGKPADYWLYHAQIEERLRVEIASWPTPTATLVPTHGDWQPRNWLIHEGVVSVIDFGRAAMRPAMSDFVRLAAQDFRRAPSLEAAFLEGYGCDPREPSAWYRNRVREAISTAAWAYRVGDETFEALGHQMISDALAAFPHNDNQLTGATLAPYPWLTS